MHQLADLRIIARLKRTELLDLVEGLVQIHADAVDPLSPVADEQAPRVVAWVDRLEDLCGLEPTDADWNDPAALPPTLRPLIEEVGRVYAPALLANAAAVAAGDAEWETEIDGTAWRGRARNQS